MTLQPPSPTPDPADELDRVDRELTQWDADLWRRAAGFDTDPPTTGDDQLDPLLDCVRMLHEVWPAPGGLGGEPLAALVGLPRRLGRFEIERVLGCGGFGIVYLATDPRLNRPVALKVPRLLSLADSRLRDRFRKEARAAAGLDHPHIIPIHETGVEGGVDYIAAAYCAGPDLDAWLRDQTVAVSPRRAAGIVACLADALHYSHQRGVLHRDLKPANVLLAEQSSASPATAGEELPFTPRLTDFGLARLLDGSGEGTAASAMLGTPNYMAPEQTAPRLGAVGPATDVHGLGVILYELLAGRPPFQAESFADVLDQVRQCEPPPLSRVRRDVPRDLEVICLKCLRKRPDERYLTAHDLGEDLRRFLRGEPIQARPPGVLTVAWKWCQRKPLAATLAALAMLLPLVGATALILHNRRLEALAASLSQSLWESREWQRRSERDRQRADERSTELAKLAYASAVRLADESFQVRDIRQCRAHLEIARQQSRNGVLLGMEWSFLDSRTQAVHRDVGAPLSEFTSVTFGPGGALLAAGGEGGQVQLIEMPGGTVRTVLSTPHDAVRNLAFDPAGERLAATGDDGTTTVWNVSDGRRLGTAPWEIPEAHGLAWLDGGRTLAVATQTKIRLWPVEGDREKAGLETGLKRVTCFAASRDGALLAWGDHDGAVRLWRTGQPGKPVAVQNAMRAKVTALVFNGAGNALAVGDNDEHVNVYRIAGNNVWRTVFIKCYDDIRSLAFSPTDDQLAILQKLGTAEICELPPPTAKPQSAATLRHGWLAHEERGSQIVWSPDGTEVVTVGRGSDRPRAWSRGETPELRRCSPGPGDGGHRCDVWFTPESQDLVLAGSRLERCVPSTGQIQAQLCQQPGWYEHLAVSPDGRWLAADEERVGAVELWSLTEPTGRPEWTLSNQRADSLRFSPRGDWFAVADWGHNSLVILERSTGTIRRTLPARQCNAVAISPQGELLVTNDLDDLVVWTTDDWQSRHRLKGHVSTIRTLEISPDGTWLASAGDDREIRLWNMTDWSDVRILSRHSREINRLTFTPDGTGVMALDQEGEITLWHVATGLPTCRVWSTSDGRAHRFALSADGQWLAVRLDDGQVLVRRLRDRVAAARL